MVLHLGFVLAEVALGPIEAHSIGSTSLGFVFIEGLNHILNPPKLLLDVDVLLAGRLSLCKHRKYRSSQIAEHYLMMNSIDLERCRKKKMMHLLRCSVSADNDPFKLLFMRNVRNICPRPVTAEQEDEKRRTKEELRESKRAKERET